MGIDRCSVFSSLGLPLGDWAQMTVLGPNVGMPPFLLGVSLFCMCVYNVSTVVVFPFACFRSC